MYCADCKRYGIKVVTIKVGTRETIEVCADTADCKVARVHPIRPSCGPYLTRCNGTHEVVA